MTCLGSYSWLIGHLELSPQCQSRLSVITAALSEHLASAWHWPPFCGPLDPHSPPRDVGVCPPCCLSMGELTQVTRTWEPSIRKCEPCRDLGVVLPSLHLTAPTALLQHHFFSSAFWSFAKLARTKGKKSFL